MFLCTYYKREGTRPGRLVNLLLEVNLCADVIDSIPQEQRWLRKKDGFRHCYFWQILVCYFFQVWCCCNIYNINLTCFQNESPHLRCFSVSLNSSFKDVSQRKIACLLYQFCNLIRCTVWLRFFFLRGYFIHPSLMFCLLLLPW